MIRPRLVAPALALVSCMLITGSARAQTAGTPPPSSSPESIAPVPAPILTLLTVPKDAQVALRGPTKLGGMTPLDLPWTATGKFSVVVEGDGLARTHGVVYLPERGALPFVLSEPRSGSMALFLRGFNYPGVNAYSGARTNRAIPMALSATAGLFMGVRSHLYYRDRLEEVGEYAEDRSRTERSTRNAWLIYTGGVYAMSALDYWIRPRLELVENTSTRLTLDVPRATRVGAMWRSLIVPGAGQEFANHRTRSSVWLSTVLVSAAGYVVADYWVSRDEVDVKWAQIGVDTAPPAELEQALLELEQEQRDLDVSRDVRRAFGIATVGFHALNLIDASVMYLSLPIPSQPKTAMITPLVSPDLAGAAVHLRF
ncbi:MAG TPA: hypothetical protein VFP58_15160 [Candidatus Eisenbacteria bacterium]|nr:hypothetical protein [Candidatus Eisenbacteria bacterium]